MIVRWPVGGIRTYLKYVYPLLDHQLGGVSMSMIVPSAEEFEILRRDLSGLDIRFVSLGERCTIASLVRVINREIIRGNFDLVHSHGFTAAVSAAAVARLRHIPHLATVHDILHEPQFVGFKGLARRLGLTLGLGAVDLVQAVSEDVARNLTEYLGAAVAGRVRVVRNGILTDSILRSAPRDLRRELELAPNTFVIGFFGRFMAQKGFRYLVEAIRVLRDRGEIGGPLHVVSFGGGGFIREERAALGRAGLNSLFTFLPFATDIGGALKGVDVVAIPSLWEASSLLSMEAMVAGVPVIGTDCIGLAEVLADSPATVVPASNHMLLADAICKEARSSTRQAAAAFIPRAIERFDASRTAAALAGLMRGLVDPAALSR